MQGSRPRLFVFDFDNTALGGHEPYDQFPEPFAHFLDELAANGIQWATNTTWSPDAQVDVIRRSGITSQPAFLAGGTGRLLAWLRNGQLIYDHQYEKMILERDRRFKEKNLPQVRQIFLELSEKKLVEPLAPDYFSPHECIISFTCREGSQEEAWKRVQPLIDSGEYYEGNPVRSRTGTLLPRHMNKGGILRIMQKRLKVKPEQTIVAGDGANDLHMLDPSLTKWMVCPANAEP